MIQFRTTILQFDKKGEKTGWSYIEISERRAQKLNPGCKVSFRVKGQIDDYIFEKVALLPMGDGSFILPVNGTIRKAIKKRRGDSVKVILQLDRRELTLCPELMECLGDDPMALSFFNGLPKSHQNYFSKWIESAKTSETKTKRIIMAVNALSNKQGFGEMIRANKSNPY
jgi:Domain of unknown function (DUF1905)/Bacteriocin-protection, YdeI or OmpD-Associated